MASLVEEIEAQPLFHIPILSPENARWLRSMGDLSEVETVGSTKKQYFKIALHAIPNLSADAVEFLTLDPACAPLQDPLSVSQEEFESAEIDSGFFTPSFKIPVYLHSLETTLFCGFDVHKGKNMYMEVMCYAEAEMKLKEGKAVSLRQKLQGTIDYCRKQEDERMSMRHQAKNTTTSSEQRSESAEEAGKAKVEREGWPVLPPQPNDDASLQEWTDYHLECLSLGRRSREVLRGLRASLTDKTVKGEFASIRNEISPGEWAESVICGNWNFLCTLDKEVDKMRGLMKPFGLLQREIYGDKKRIPKCKTAESFAAKATGVEEEQAMHKSSEIMEGGFREIRPEWWGRIDGLCCY